MCYSLCLLAPPSEMHMKAAVTSYVVCVVRNMEFSEHYFSAKHAIVFAPTVCLMFKMKKSFIVYYVFFMYFIEVGD